MSVTNHNPEYDYHIESWELVRDCAKGEKAVKKRTFRYLPKPNKADRSKENQQRYDDYLQRALFVNYTSRTKRGLIGAIFRKPPQIDLPPPLAYMVDDATRSGMSLADLAKMTVGDVMESGRCGLLADYPQVEEALTLADSQKNKAYIIHYNAEQVINWHVNQAGVVDLVVLREDEEVESSPFNYDLQPRYRVLRLIDGDYVQEYYDEGGVRMWQAVPRKSDGSTFKELPFAWVGAEDNDETIDSAPLYDIAKVNIGHYRNSADYEESCFMVGQPTPIISGLTQSWVEDNPGPYLIGSRAAWLLPEGGAGALMQASPNQMPQQAMLDKQDQMVAIGARIIQEGGGNETAEAARIRHSGENSMLTTLADNTNAAYLKVIGWCSEFMGAAQDIEFELNTEFFEGQIDAQMIMAQMQLVDRGDMAQKDLRANMRRVGVIDNDRTDDELDLEAADSVVSDTLDV